MMKIEHTMKYSFDELYYALPSSYDKEEMYFVRDAYFLAKEAHDKQTRENGVPYMMHPRAMALILMKEMLQRDPNIIAAALLHDVVEKTNLTLEDIREKFGDDVAFLIDASKELAKEETDFQRILESVEGDVRVLVLELSERLHDLRVPEELPQQELLKIASETLAFYAPLTDHLALSKVKIELENKAFQLLNPSEFASIEKAIEEDRARTRKATKSLMYHALQSVSKVFGGAIGWDIRYRQPYSIWREMQEKGCHFDQVPIKHYIRAVFNMEDVEDETFRTDLNEVEVVKLIRTTLAEAYHEQEGSLIDYIAHPKPNGYMGYHIRFQNPFGGIEEFHICSENMRYFSGILFRG